MRSRLILIPLVVVLLSVASCSGGNEYGNQFKLPERVRLQDQPTVKFGRVPSETITSLLREHSSLSELLSEELSIDVTFRFADDYYGIINGMSRSQYDFVWLGPYSYVLSTCASETSASYKPLVRPIRPSGRNQQGDSYRGIIFARNQADITELSDLSGETVAFVEKHSTSGYLFPKARMLEEGINPRKDFAEIKFMGRHDRVVEAVKDGEAVAGAVYQGARRSTLDWETSKIDRVLPVIAQTKPIPTSPIAVSGSFAERRPETTKKFKQIMLNLHERSKGRKILKSQRIVRYKSAAPSDYEVVKSVFERLRATMPRDDKLCQIPSKI